MSEIQRRFPEVRRYELGAIRVAPPPPPPVAPPEDNAPVIDALLREAEATLAHARARQEAVLKEREEALAAARAQGLQEGREQAALEAAQGQAELKRLLDALPEAFERFCLAQAPHLTELCVTAAEKILQEQLSLEPERVRAIVRSAIAHVPHSQHLTVQVHPDDLPFLQEAGLAEGTSRTLVLEPDPQLQRGGCRIESRQGVVDASLEGALVRLSGILTEA